MTQATDQKVVPGARTRQADNIVTDGTSEYGGEVTQSQDLRYVKSLFMRLRAWWHRRRSSRRDRTQTTAPPTQ